MRIWLRLCGSIILACFLSLALVGPAFAGGWAVVTLDTVPQGPQAGQTLSLGFMVRQHGVTPIDGAYGGATMIPILTARNAASGETVRAEARKAGPVGHFVVDVAFPSAGEWAWQIAPAPFGPTDLGTLTVLAAGAAKSQPATTAGGAKSPTTAEPTALITSNLAPVRDGLRWLGIALLIMALGLGLWGQRATFLRRDPAVR